MLRIGAAVGLGLYGTANVFAAAYDLATVQRLPLYVDLFLLGIGGLLLVATASVALRRGPARSLALIGLALAFLVAVYDERVLGLGSPVHHLIRGVLTVALLLALWRSRRPGVDSEPRHR